MKHFFSFFPKLKLLSQRTVVIWPACKSFSNVYIIDVVGVTGYYFHSLFICLAVNDTLFIGGHHYTLVANPHETAGLAVRGWGGAAGGVLIKTLAACPIICPY